ncbi:hypothetical protein OG2516_18480 [Oceanicola granulosus HTCC2516]|uniref:TauD/TfdA-like domain-containing protein n=1 Tax=Oceanicola granulosus (strain ATCC BAA-861 / DSM 15982 / KCTC 12143 / HTCC2516) TaxID=314256 RepID=Q2CHG0_OCEGH|nr:TauD/TfdA family dioxygenase [Oceanicola granulosus]EAR52079.1 hypothetical protein OG2516_18480 [Oceanicola granulosus HTCC2516]
MTSTDAGPGPTLAIDEQRLRASADPAAAIRQIADRIIAALRTPPCFVRLTGLAPTEDRSLAVALARTIAITPPHPPGFDRDRLLKVSFTQVRIDRSRAENAGAVTAYSRTNQPLALHTDSSYLAKPHPLVLFQFIRSAADGGASTMACADDIVAALPPPLVETLARPQFPFGKGPMPILFGRRSAPQMRYYRSQIDTAAEEAGGLPQPLVTALDRLDEILEQVPTYEFKAQPGEIVFMQNTRVLHGRRGFGGDSDRLMYRIRMHGGALG